MSSGRGRPRCWVMFRSSPPAESGQPSWRVRRVWTPTCDDLAAPAMFLLLPMRTERCGGPVRRAASRHTRNAASSRRVREHTPEAGDVTRRPANDILRRCCPAGETAKESGPPSPTVSAVGAEALRQTAGVPSIAIAAAKAPRRLPQRSLPTRVEYERCATAASSYTTARRCEYAPSTPNRPLQCPKDDCWCGEREIVPAIYRGKTILSTSFLSKLVLGTPGFVLGWGIDLTRLDKGRRRGQGVDA